MTQAHTRDFSRRRPPVYFTIDDVRFDCHRALDLEQLRRFANLAAGMGSLVADAQDIEQATRSAEVAADAIDRILGVMKIVMKKSSYLPFAARVKPTDEDRERDDFEPVDHLQLTDIIKWLMGVYTNRPSQPSSNSPAGSASDDGGSSSTAGASPAESTRGDLPETTH